MKDKLFQIACNPKLSLTIRYEIARYLQAQRKQQRKKGKEPAGQCTKAA